VIRAHLLGDAEVEQPRLPFGGDEHVGGLDVAMHDQRAVRVHDRRTHLQEQVEHGVERLARAPLVDRQALDVFHDQEGAPVRRLAAVQQARDVGVLEPRQRLALAAKPFDRLLVALEAGHELDRDLLGVGVVGAFGQPDLAHAALPQQPHQSIGANAPVWRLRAARRRRRMHRQYPGLVFVHRISRIAPILLWRGSRGKRPCRRIIAACSPCPTIPCSTNSR
jgi:hypothetical protein